MGWLRGRTCHGEIHPKGLLPSLHRPLPLLLSPFPFRFCFPLLRFFFSLPPQLGGSFVKPTAPYQGQNKGEVERWDFELMTTGLTLSGLTEEMKVEEMSDFQPPRSLLKHTDPCRGFPCYCSGHGCSAGSSHPGFQLTVPQSGQHCVPFSPQSGLSLSEFRATRGSLGRFLCPSPSPVGVKPLGRAVGWRESS